jgi:hypothetical protein
MSSRFIFWKDSEAIKPPSIRQARTLSIQHFRRGNNSVLDPAKSGITRTGSSSSKAAEIDPNHQQDTAWGLSKSA